MVATIGHKISEATRRKISPKLTNKPRQCKTYKAREGIYPDIGCEYASIYLGAETSRCEFCPFSDCISGGRVKLAQLYLHWADLARWVYKERKPDIHTLALMFGIRVDSMKRILGNGDKSRRKGGR